MIPLQNIPYLSPMERKIMEAPNDLEIVEEALDFMESAEGGHRLHPDFIARCRQALDNVGK